MVLSVFPLCEKCGVEMRRKFAMPPVSAAHKGTTVFECSPCQIFKWIDD